MSFRNIFNKQTFKYIFTTHFWGPVSNFGIPVAAVMDLKKDPDYISGPMTGSLILYSLVFMRYSLAITPKNYLLFGCHFVNEAAQIGQGFRWLKHHYSEKEEPVKSWFSRDFPKILQRFSEDSPNILPVSDILPNCIPPFRTPRPRLRPIYQ